MKYASSAAEPAFRNQTVSVLCLCDLMTITSNSHYCTAEARPSKQSQENPHAGVARLGVIECLVHLRVRVGIGLARWRFCGGGGV